MLQEGNKDYDENIHLIFSYINAYDDLRFRKIVSEIDPLEARKIVAEGTDLTMLHWAALKGAEVIQNWLIDNMEFPADLDDNIEIWSPAHVATIGGKNNCLESLLKRKPEVVNRTDKKGCTPIHLAAAHGRFHCLKLLLKSTRILPNVNIQCILNKWTPLMYAAWHGRISCVELLIRHGASTDMVNNEGRSALHLCAAEGHLVLVKYFLEEGCIDTNLCLEAVDNQGLTALNLAEMNKKDDVCKFLIEKSNDPKTWETVDDIKFPGHISALNGDFTNIKILVENGNISVNDTDPRGYSLLHKACVGGHVRIAKYLINKGATIWMKTLGGETALDIATRKQHRRLIEILKKEQSRYEPYIKAIQDENKIFIPLLTSLDSISSSSIDPTRLNELITEHRHDIINLEERISDYENILESLKPTTDTSEGERNFETPEEKKQLEKTVNHEMLKLKYQLNLLKFNLYQLTKEPTAHEIEIAEALANCEHQFEEISDQLSYEREVREQTEAELSRTMIHLLKLRDFILKNDVSDELVSMVASFDKYLTGAENTKVIINSPQINENKKYSIHFEMDVSECITISSVTYYSNSKRTVKKDIQNLTKKQFINFIKLILNPDREDARCKKHKKNKSIQKKLISAKGGIFVTNK